MDANKQQQQQQPEVNNNSSRYDSYAEAEDLETETSSMVTIFQRDHVEISEDDELADNLQELSHHAPTSAVHQLRGELSSASLPRVNRFCTKWLKQTNRSDATRQAPQEQPLSLSGDELSHQTRLALDELDKAIGQQPEEQLLECLTSSVNSDTNT